jgi:hypothetical protein
MRALPRTARQVVPMSLPLRDQSLYKFSRFLSRPGPARVIGSPITQTHAHSDGHCPCHAVRGHGFILAFFHSSSQTWTPLALGTWRIAWWGAAWRWQSAPWAARTTTGGVSSAPCLPSAPRHVVPPRTATLPAASRAAPRMYCSKAAGTNKKHL